MLKKVLFKVYAQILILQILEFPFCVRYFRHLVGNFGIVPNNIDEVANFLEANNFLRTADSITRISNLVEG